MKIFKRKFYMALAFAVVLSFSLVQVPKAYSAELTVQEKALSAIRDVIGLDPSKYNAQLTRYTSGVPSDIGGPDYGGLSEESVTYTLEAAEAKMDVQLKFINKTLVTCSLYKRGDSRLPPLSAQQLPPNMIDATKVILQRLQTYMGASYTRDMRTMLDTVTEVKNMATTVGNLKCTIQVVDEYYTAFTWFYTSKGVDYPKTVGVYFENRSLLGFGDHWNLYTIGSDSVNISREEAIRIAREQAEKNATSVMFSSGEVVKFNLTGRVDATISGVTREPWTAYPFWHIQLYTDIYGGVNQIQVGIWADTGIIKYCKATGFYGDVGGNPPESTSQSPPPETSPPSESDAAPNQPTETSTASTENSTPSTSMYIAATVAAVTIAVATAAVFIKKRSK